MVIAIAHQARTDPSFRELHDATRAEGTRVLRAVLEEAYLDDSTRPGLDVDLAISMLVGPLLHRHLFDTKRLTTGDIERIVDSFLAANGP